MIVAALDAGGTTFKCGLIKGKTIVARTRIPTTHPEETLQACITFFQAAQAEHGNASYLGVGSFGPLDRQSGRLLDTPKPGWSHVPLVERLSGGLDLPCVVDTDVNAALIAEVERGAARGCLSAAYITVGTGIGAGLMAEGHLLGAPGHPEFGHIPVRRRRFDRANGQCPYHGDCLEGLVSGSALTARFGNLPGLPASHPAWELIGYYLAQACLVLTLTYSPQKIILGGGVMQSDHILPHIHRAFEELNASYWPFADGGVEDLVVKPDLGADAGLWGAYCLALRSLEE